MWTALHIRYRSISSLHIRESIYAAIKCLIGVHSQRGETPLMTASFEGHVNTVRLLIEAKAQLNMQTEVIVIPTPARANTSIQQQLCMLEMNGK